MKVREEELVLDAETGWHGDRRARVRWGDRTALACTITPRQDAWYVTDCLPHRRDPRLAAALLEVCSWLITHHGAPDVIAIHPEFWELPGATLLQRMLPMWLGLDDDVLQMHTKRLPDGYRFAPLDPAPLGDEDDLRVWRDSWSGTFGPLVEDASLMITAGQDVRAAVAVTEYHGAPLIGHLLVAEAERGTGLGRALLVESLKGLSRAGYVDCHLNVLEDNWVAYRLYRSVGFVRHQPTLQVSHLSGGA